MSGTCSMLPVPTRRQMHRCDRWSSTPWCFWPIVPVCAAANSPDSIWATWTSSRARSRSEIGRAHVYTPVTNAHLVCRLLLEKKNEKDNEDSADLHYQALRDL